jgi:hypothetical protein
LDDKKEGIFFRAGSGQIGELIRSQGLYIPIESSFAQDILTGKEIRKKGREEIWTYSLPDEHAWGLEIKLKKHEVTITGSPLLPDSRWELFLPLRGREETIGMIWIHTAEMAGFSLEDTTHFQFLADQIAVRL